MRTLTRSTFAIAFAALCGAALALGCGDDTTSPGTEVPADQFQAAPVDAGAPAFVSLSRSFVVTAGRDTSIALCVRALVNPDAECPRSILRLEFGAGSLVQRPGGMPFQAGDTLTITLRVVDPSRLLFELDPSGVVFSSTDPVRLRIRTEFVARDLNRDGVIDAKDRRLLARLGIWRQEHTGDPFVRLPTSTLDQELGAELSGFSRYAISY